MNKISILIFLAAFLLTSPVVQANSPHHDSRGTMQEMRLDEKFFMKAKFFIYSKEAIGLSEEQVQQIKDLKHQVQKDLIRREADIDVLKVDIKTKLHENPVDVAGLNAMMDQKYEMKKKKAKMLVQAIADLKAVLSGEQYEMMKNVWYKRH